MKVRRDEGSDKSNASIESHRITCMPMIHKSISAVCQLHREN